MGVSGVGRGGFFCEWAEILYEVGQLEVYVHVGLDEGGLLLQPPDQLPNFAVLLSWEYLAVERVNAQEVKQTTLFEGLRPRAQHLREEAYLLLQILVEEV